WSSSAIVATSIPATWRTLAVAAGSTAALPFQPNHKPPCSRRAADSAMARPPLDAPSRASTSATRLETTTSLAMHHFLNRGFPKNTREAQRCRVSVRYLGYRRDGLGAERCRSAAVDGLLPDDGGPFAATHPSYCLY